MRRVLLDTSAYSAFFRGHEGVVRALQMSDLICMNPIVLGELRAGFERGSTRGRNYEQLREFHSSPRVQLVDITGETSTRYASILTGLRTAGRPIPTNDLWIAASAMEHGLRLLTTDRHFRLVSQVLVDYFEALG